MFKPVIHGGLRGLILASAASLMFGGASWSLEFPPSDPPPPEDTRSALEKVKDARSGEEASEAAKDLREDRPGGRD